MNVSWNGTKDGNCEDTAYASFETFYEGMFQKARLLDIMKNFILFSGASNSRFKVVLAAYHQYFAVHVPNWRKRKMATKTDGKRWPCNSRGLYLYGVL